MKKQIIIAVLFICLFFANTIYANDCVVISQFNVVNINHDDIDCFVAPKISKKEESLVVQDSSIFKVSATNNNDINFVVKAQNLINKLPLNLQSLLTNNGWKMVITEDNLAKKYFNGVYNSVMGVTLYEENIIYIEDRNNAINDSVIHEFGHAIDKELGYISNTKEFLDALSLDNYGMTLLCGNYTHWKDNNAEAFAESMNLYYKDPNQFNIYCPNLSSFINNELSQ